MPFTLGQQRALWFTEPEDRHERANHTGDSCAAGRVLYRSARFRVIVGIREYPRAMWGHVALFPFGSGVFLTTNNFIY
jgi:hypothetical protein